jgi:hypothetical protein
MSSHSHHTASCPPAQPPLADSDRWTTEVVPRLPADLDVQAHHLGALVRKRAVTCAADLLRALLASVLISTSLQHLGAWAVLTDLANISAVAWHKRLRKSKPFLCWLLGELLAPPQPPIRLVPHARGNVLLVDATRLRQHGGTGDDWRLHTAFNLTIGRLVQVTVTDRHGGEHLGHYRMQAGDSIVADNGYGYRRSVALARKQQGEVVIRIRPSTFPFEQANGMRMDVVAQLRKRGPAVREWRGWCTDDDGERYRVRLIAAKLPPQEAAAARRRVRKQAQKRGRCAQPETVLVAGWVLLITTLDGPGWPPADVLRLYRARWHVELVDKRMQSILKLNTLRAVTRESVEASIGALLVAWALQEDEARVVRRILGQLTRTTQAVVSTWGLTALQVDVLRQQVRGAWGQARIRACLRHLARVLTSRMRGRGHQETEVRAWLERRPAPSRWTIAEAA